METEGRVVEGESIAGCLLCNVTLSGVAALNRCGVTCEGHRSRLEVKYREYFT